MKLTKSQFKQLLKEEITNVFETHGLEQAAQAMATAGAYELPPQAMQRLMRVINQTSIKLTDEETIELANALIGADMLKTAAEAPEEVGLEEIVKEALERMGAQVQAEQNLTMVPGKYSQHGAPVYDVLKGERKAGELSARRGNKGIYWIFELEPNEDPTEYGMPYRTGIEKNQEVFDYDVGPEDALEWLKGTN